MKSQNKIQSGIIAIASGLMFSAFAIAADPSRLIGMDLDQNRDLVDTVMQGRNYIVQVDQDGKIKQVIDTGANGDGKDPVQTVNGVSITNTATTVSSVELPVNYEGQHAIDYLGADLPKVAANYGLTSEKLQEILLNDNTARIDSDNRMFYIDDSTNQHMSSDPKIAGGVTSTSTNNPPVPIASPAQLNDAFKLHSKPGASKTLYLNFVGYTATKTAWAPQSSLIAPPFDLSGNPTIFDDNERSNIISIWNRVSEDYIPFDVDVTTEPPSSDALLRTSAADATYGTQVVITKTGTISCNCGGVAYVGVVSMVNNTYYQPAWVFQQSLANNEKYIAEAISHEAGHTLGLFHDGQTNGGTTTGYYSGHGSGDTGWAPIMGVGYYKNVTQWSSGAYPGANNQQNDIAVMASNGIASRSDDVGNSISTASSLTNTGTGSTAIIQTFGVIETSSDVDMFIVNTTGGLINLSVSPASKGPNLDTKLTLYRNDGSAVASGASEASLAATINANLPAGTYFLAVSGSSHASSSTDYGYPTYGSLGQYKITGSYPASNSTAIAPTAILTASTLSGPASLSINFSANNSVGNGNITGYRWTFGDGTSSTQSNPVHTYTKVGTYTATLTVTNQYMLTSTKSVQINVSAPPQPTFYVGSVSMTVIKNGKVTPKVEIKVIDNNGRPVSNALVTGTWSGAFSGKLSSITNAYGSVTHTAKPTNKTIGASGTYTIDNISATGYIYNPTKNVKSVATIAW